jgi:hypothetical protein
VVDAPTARRVAIGSTGPARPTRPTGPPIRSGSASPAWRPKRAIRRIVSGLVLLAVVVLGVAAVSTASGDGPPTVDDRAPSPVASVAVVARPGDTLWSIARQIQPEGDVRPLVDVLAAQRQGRPLAPGDVVAWPPLPQGR